jgi:uncharacterized protein YggU (UPF0235/DUF167 family)
MFRGPVILGTSSAVTLESGATARLKVLRIAGDPAELEARLAVLIGAEK